MFCNTNSKKYLKFGSCYDIIKEIVGRRGYVKRTFCIFFSIIFMINLTGCSLFSKDSSDDIGENNTAAFSYLQRLLSDNGGQSDKSNTTLGNVSIPYQSIESKNSYITLQDGIERELYGKISESKHNIQSQENENKLYPIDDIILEGQTLEEDTIRKVVIAFGHDNPDVFWLSNVFGYEIKDNNTIIKLFSYLPLGSCEEAESELNSKVDSVLSDIPAELSEYEREKYVYNWMIENCQYDKDVNNRSNKWQSFTAYGAIVESKAVCEGYSRAMKLLLNRLGIECQLVTGYTNQTPHMWNIVKIDGNYYHLDATFDTSSQIKLYDYFNISDNQVERDHVIDPNYYNGMNRLNGQYNLNIPICEKTTANYFESEGIVINSLDEKTDEIVVNSLVKLASEGKESAPFRISDDLNYQETIIKMLSKPPYKLLYYVNEANERLDSSHQIDTQRLSYIESGIQNAFVLKLTYK